MEISDQLSDHSDINAFIYAPIIPALGSARPVSDYNHIRVTTVTKRGMFNIRDLTVVRKTATPGDWSTGTGLNGADANVT